MSTEFENSMVTSSRTAGLKSSSQEARKEIAGVKPFRILFLTIGAICMLQAVLNISLRLALLHKLQQGWLYFSGSLYYISSIKKNWTDSRNDCLQRGAHLAIINSREKHEFAQQQKKTMWIGLTDRDSENNWRWVDKSLVGTSFWCSGEPNAYNDEDCVQMTPCWNDLRCQHESFFLCEKKMM
ncbi:C-type lectin domain family 17, member A-like isoform 2-T2 [Pholidichthys leucotaenia]